MVVMDDYISNIVSDRDNNSQISCQVDRKDLYEGVIMIGRVKGLLVCVSKWRLTMEGNLLC